MQCMQSSTVHRVPHVDKHDAGSESGLKEYRIWMCWDGHAHVCVCVCVCVVVVLQERNSRPIA